jgi:Leucine-rich repeat (LRR) protein
MKALLLISLLLFGCSENQIAGKGGSSEAENAIVGRVLYPDGTPAARVEVSAISTHFIPSPDSVALFPKDTTDGNGEFTIQNIVSGDWTIFVGIDSLGARRALQLGIDSLGDLGKGDLGWIRLAPTSMVRGEVDLTPGQNAIISIQGSPWFSTVDSLGRYEIPSIPEGSYQLHVLADSILLPKIQFSVLGGDTVSIDRLGTQNTIGGDLIILRDYLDNLGIRDFAERIAITSNSRIVGLDLTDLNLRTLPSFPSGLDSIHTIILRGNPLDSFPSSVLAFPGLSLLDLGKTGIQSLPITIESVPWLYALMLDSNRISNYPNGINRLPFIHILDLTGNQIQVIPDSMTNLTHLTILNLGYNQIRKLPDSLGSVESLRILSVHNNLLDSLPSSIGDLDSLQQLWAGVNRIRSLPSTMQSLSILDTLQLDANLLDSLPSWIGNLQSLELLYLLDNSLSSLPASIVNLTNMAYLRVRGNNLCTEPAPVVAWIETHDEMGIDWLSWQNCP